MLNHEFGPRRYPRVARRNVAQAGKITGMLWELSPATVRHHLIDEVPQQEHIHDAGAAAATGAGANPAAMEAASAVDVDAAAAAVRGAMTSPKGR